jgi:hypothetical protein
MKIFLTLCLIPLLTNYSMVDKIANSKYKVTRLSEPVEINGIWEKPAWKDVPPLTINHYMGKKPKHKPKVQAKVAYDEEAIYVIFKVKDQYVRCVTEEYQGSVYKDSCVEFFFTPAPEVSKGYFNLEMNCIGTALFKFHDKEKDRLIEVPESDFDRIKVAHSIPSVVLSEITEPITWTVEYRIPISILAKYFDVAQPAPGVQWKANFYKIADDTSHPHWLTWSVVDLPKPDFHRPEFFGTLEF